MYVCICIELCLKDENVLSISAKLYDNINLLTTPRPLLRHRLLHPRPHLTGSILQVKTKNN